MLPLETIHSHSIRKKNVLQHTPLWSTSSGMISWIGRVILFTSGVRSTTVRIIQSRPSTSCSMTTLFHMCYGRASCSSAISALLKLVDACCRCWTSFNLLKVLSYSLCYRVRNSSACFYLIQNSFVMLPFVSACGPDGIAVSLSPVRKLVGVNAAA